MKILTVFKTGSFFKGYKGGGGRGEKGAEVGWCFFSSYISMEEQAPIHMLNSKICLVSIT